jgi:hypothetical protein
VRSALPIANEIGRNRPSFTRRSRTSDAKVFFIAARPKDAETRYVNDSLLTKLDAVFDLLPPVFAVWPFQPDEVDKVIEFPISPDASLVITDELLDDLGCPIRPDTTVVVLLRGDHEMNRLVSVEKVFVSVHPV